jgi:3-keto-disaccharide hydrolase
MSDRSPLRWIVSFAAILSFVALRSASAADDTSKPNSLTPKEIEEGWILLFDGETTFGWNAEGSVDVKNGILKIGGDNAGAITSSAPFHHGLLRCTARQSGALKGEITWRGEKQTPGGGASWSTLKWEPAAGGGSTIGIEVPAGSELEIRQLAFQPRELKPLFNAKDLSGWKVFPGERYKSHFSVTQEGWLNVKNGPGDLQTEGQYDDFILQLECISNGKALNSGVFFRCVAGQYQNGYEAQIQNGYKDGDRTKPVDFGTGAIYRRVPARKVVSNDHEWFTMTIAAQGKHVATWVNGYQTVDWTDERPPNDNPRNGSKTGKGHISIQGHDPTTDLSFRNIRIAELPKEK